MPDPKHISPLMKSAMPSGGTASDESAYLLTPEEEAQALQEAIARRQDTLRWSMVDRGATLSEVQATIAATDWDTAIDRDSVLSRANKMKLWKRQDEIYRQNRKAREMEAYERLRAMWTAEHVYKEIARRSREKGRALIINADTLPLIKIICFRISDDPRYVTETGMDPMKGILLRGLPGVGKSYIPELIADNPIHPLQIHPMIEIPQQIRETGVYPIKYNGDNDLIYLDDIGTEYDLDADNRIKHYGTDINFFKNFIEKYYIKGSGQYHRLIISTNDSFDILQAKYGRRVRSRLAQMFNVVTVTGDDLRKISNHQIHQS